MRPAAPGARQHVSAWLWAATLPVLAAGCNQPAPSWQSLIAGKISDQYPAYRVLPAPGDGLVVERPGTASIPVDVAAIAAFCRRGPKDCDYAVDQLLLRLAPGPR